ncbi:peptidoglycan DD-metalloendopeptidase family protein [Halomonas organivorans]|uniref:Lipoprotein NlpD n=1 Tax=Halomonas organivorans TaxID=257772 RepID=A0A7W5BZZ7_9GAMM|nr:peptidoglycan DD-metalloendopeptidase family protein [Halomonas organivorans]MBB3142117.1 lipoprotein NlpD [Halomonas organivorans]
MHKVLLISGLALTLAGCAASQQAPQPVRVQDLSASRAADRPASYTVEPGDTLYGIAWRHDMDYRDLARLNQIEPPYRIQPGQQLSLGGSAAASGGGAGESGEAVTAAAASAGGAVATGLGGGTQDDGSLDWLLPDGSTERSGVSADNGNASSQASAEGQEGSGTEGPGPVYDADSPGADGNLSERDLAERSEREAQAQAETQSQAEAQSQSQEAEERQVADSGAQAGAESDAQADAGTQVAGEPAAESRESRRYTPVDDVPWQWPVNGEVVGDFGEGGSITAGIDIDGQKGQPVKAAGPGIVVYAGSGVRGYGNLILLKHNDQFLSAYAHNDTLRVKENDVVEAGEVIATMGDSDAEDVRLHFEVRKDGQPQDPLEYLPKR